MRTRTAPQRGFNLDYLMWLFTRLSGLSLFVLALIGAVGAMLLGAREQVDLPALMRWTYFPNPNHVVNSSIPDVTQGWANAFWQIMMILVLFFGVTHGFNGLRMVIEDYLGQSVSQVLLRGVIFLLWLFFLVMGVFVILAS
jgi:succinate dehydrogenase / fumarate reductase, membrane anchor subunit